MKAICLLLLFSILSLQAQEYMEFDVRKLEMDKADQELPLKGKVEANFIKLDFGGELFEILGDEADPFRADVTLSNEGRKLAFQNGRLRFSTPLDAGNPLAFLETLLLRYANVRLTKNEISMQGKVLQFRVKNLNSRFEGANINCPTDGRFSTEIDKICLTKSLSKLELLSLKRNGIDFDAYNVDADIQPTHFSVKAASAVFKDTGSESHIVNFRGQCNNLVQIKELEIDQYRLLGGCLEQGAIHIDRMNMDTALENVIIDSLPEEKRKGLVDLDDIKKIQLTFNNGTFTLKGKVKALFRIPIKVIGQAQMDRSTEELRLKISKTSVLGFPAKNLAIKLVKKFVRSDSVRIEGDIIILKI